MLSIFSTGPLVIDAIGETPIGAWIPGSGSKLTIQKARSTTSTTTRYEIFEDFSSRARKQESKDDDWTKDPSILGPENYPIVDFIGPTFASWSDTPIKFYGHRDLVFTSPNSTPEEKFVSVFVIKVPFALRAVMGDFDYSQHWMPTLNKNRFMRQKISRMLVNAPAEGILKATLSETPQGPVDYSNLEQSIDGHPIIVARVQDGPFKGSMIFRKPPIPSFDGFNVFGQVQKIEFEAASGKIMLGTQQQNIEPSAPIGILNANAYETPAPKLTIPI